MSDFKNRFTSFSNILAPLNNFVRQVFISFWRMFCISKNSFKFSELLKNSGLIEHFSKSYNNHVEHKMSRHNFFNPVLLYFAPGSHFFREEIQPKCGTFLMQLCSFSQSRAFFIQSEIKEVVVNGQDMAQNKRVCETRGNETGEKKMRFDENVDLGDSESVKEFFMPSREWQQYYFPCDSTSAGGSDAIPFYEDNYCGPNRPNADESLHNSEQRRRMDNFLENIAAEAIKDMRLKEVQNLRPWQLTDFGHKMKLCKDEGIVFTLMTYNILAQDLLESNFWLYGHCEKAVLDWELRSRNLLSEIRDAQPDIICLQELNQTHYKDYFYPQLQSLGWNSLYKKRTGGKQDGCAIFFKSSLFELESYVNVEYFKPNIRHLDKDNVGLIVSLKPRSRGKHNTKLCVATTHLLFNPRRGDIKLSQLQLLLAEMDRMAFKGNGENGVPLYHPVILCGDMNSEPYSPIYQFLTSGELMYDGLMSGDISGQKAGINGGRTIQSKDLYIPDLGVTFDCQYTNLKAKRMELGAKVNPSHEKGRNYSNIGHSVRHFGHPAWSFPIHRSCQDQSCSSVNSQSAVPPGYIRHKFNFVSAYKHINSKGEIFVTTHHKKSSCTVDYIFYSVKKQNQQRPGLHVEDSLRLIGTRRLPTEKELTDLGGLPNDVLSSDHLSLISKFFLNLSPYKT